MNKKYFVSAGRLYDKIGDTATGTILYIIPQGVICYVNDEKEWFYERVVLYNQWWYR